jgi:Subtilase family/Bacterial TSP3 repeat
MKRSPLQLTSLVLLLAVAFPSQAVDLTALYDNARTPTAFGMKVLEAFQGKDLKGKDGPMHKIGMDLIVTYEEFTEFQARGGRKALGSAFKPGNPLVRTHGETVVIDAVATDSTETLRQELVALGMQHTAVFGHMVSGYLPIRSLKDVAALNTLRLARPAYARTLAGAVTSQGDAAMRSDLARTSFGVNGNGVLVGTLSDSYDCTGGAANDVTSGDLPAGVVVLQELTGCTSGTDEGRAMMQIVHDIAPGSTLAFHSAFNGVADFASGIIELANAGAKVINDDVIYFAEPMFQDGPIAQAVDTVKAMGVAYFSAAGNEARQSYEDTFLESGVAGYFSGSTRHDFNAGSGVDTLQQITINGNTTAYFVFQWQDRYASVSGSPGAATDLDIIVYRSNGQYISGGIDNNIGGDPIEIFSVTNNKPFSQSYQLGLERSSGPAPGRIKYVYFGNVTINEYATNSSTLYGHPNAAGAQAVGAARYTQTPAFGVSPPLLEYFSSAGGTPILFNITGAPVNLMRQKPEIVAPDGGNTTFFYPGSDFEPDGFPNFFGTSAAAPHAAGVAALLLDRDPTLTPDGIYNALQGSALDMNSPGFDYDSGYGLIQADTALASLDTDGDGVLNSNDLCPGTATGESVDTSGCSAFQKDTDGDMLSDGLESVIGTDPSLPDTDGDGLTDFQEVNWDGDATAYNPVSDLNPLAVDTDNDGFRDGMEVEAGYDPLLATSYPVWGDINDDRVVDTVDALLASRAVLGLVTLTNAELARGNVAPLVNGTPQPPAVDDGFDLADLLLIERKALGVVSY